MFNNPALKTVSTCLAESIERSFYQFGLLCQNYERERKEKKNS